jgi:HAD superfamily hydrolase (TIGR01509 family)
VIFDFDGVLVDSEPWWDRCDRRVVEEAGGVFLADAKQRVMGLPEPQAVERIIAMHGLSVAPEDLMARRLVWMAQYYAQEIPLMPGVPELLEGLQARGLPLAIATSTRLELARIALRRHGLEPAFRTVVTAADVKHGKPAPDVFLEAARRLGVPMADCAVVEDSLPGMRAARASGGLAVWLRNAHAAAAEAEAHAIIEKPLDLLAIL